MLKSVYNRLSAGGSDAAFWVTTGSTIAAFLMMLQIYLVAPLINDMSKELGSSGALMGLMIPSITIPLGLSALMSARLTSRLGERRLKWFTLLSLSLGALLIALSPNALLFIACRIITGLALGALLPLSFKLTAQHYPIERRFFPIMIIVFGMAAGMTFGPVLGALLYPLLGWRVQFLIIAAVSGILCLVAKHFSFHHPGLLRGEAKVLIRKAYEPTVAYERGNLFVMVFIFLNSVFHSGLFVWTSTVLTGRYRLGEISAGILLLDFGLPGLVLVVILGIFSKGPSRVKMEITGLAIIGFCITLIMMRPAVWLNFLAVALLSIGYNITQPLFFGIVGRMGNSHQVQFGVQLGCCCLFTGYGAGPLIFGVLMSFGTLSSVLLLLFLVACLATISNAIFQDQD